MTKQLTLACALTFGFLMTAANSALAATGFVVEGNVLSVKPKTLIIESQDHRFEINRDALSSDVGKSLEGNVGRPNRVRFIATLASIKSMKRLSKPKRDPKDPRQTSR